MSESAIPNEDGVWLRGPDLIEESEEVGKARRIALKAVDVVEKIAVKSLGKLAPHLRHSLAPTPRTQAIPPGPPLLVTLFLAPPPPAFAKPVRPSKGGEVSDKFGWARLQSGPGLWVPASRLQNGQFKGYDPVDFSRIVAVVNGEGGRLIFGG